MRLVPELPANYPFSPFLSSLDPMGIYPDARLDGSGSLDPQRYDFPYLGKAHVDDILTCIASGGVVDPLNHVLWGDVTMQAVDRITKQLDGWVRTLASAPQWGLGETGQGEQRVEVAHSIQPFWGPALPLVINLTRVVGSFARQHVRVFQPFYAGPPWGYIALVGAHTERIGTRGQFPYLWHRVQDWHEARDRLAEDLLQFAVDPSPVERLLPTKGRWQRRSFDGVVKFLHFDGSA